MASKNNNMNIKVSAETSNLDSRLQRVSKNFTNLGRNTKAANGSMGAFYNSTRKMNQQFNNINRDANRAAGGINVFKKALSFTAGLASLRLVADYIGGAINASMDAIETQNMYSVALGDMKGEADKVVDSLSTLYGLDPTNMKSNIGTYALLAKSMGMSSSQAEILSTQIYQLALDESSLMNIPLEQVMADLKSGLVGQSETVYKYGMDVTEAGLKTEALAEGISKSVRNMSQGEKMALRFNTMIKNGSLAVGDFAKTLETPANQSRILTERMTTLSRSIGSIFMGVIGSILPYLNAFVIVLIDAADAVATFFGFLGILDTSAGTSLGSVTDDADNVASAVGGATSALKEMKNASLGMDELNVIDTSAGASGGGGGGGASGSILDTMKLSQVYDGLDGIQSKSAALAETIKGIFDPLKPQFDNLVGSFKSLSDFGQAFYDNILEPIGSWVIGTGLGLLMDILTKFNTEIVPKLTDVLPSVKKFIDEFLLPIATWVMGEAVPAFIDLFGDFLELVNPIIAIVVDACVKLWTDFLKPIGGWIIGTGFDVLGSFFTTIGGVITAHPDLAAVLTDIATALLLIQTVKFTASAFAPLVSVLTSAPNALGGLKKLAGANVYGTNELPKGMSGPTANKSGTLSLGDSIKGALAGVTIGVIISDWLTGKDVIAVAGDVFSQIFSGAAEEAGASVGGFWDYINNEQDMRDLWADTPLGDFAGWLEEHIGINIFKSPFQTLVDGFKGIGTDIKTSFDDAIARIVAGFQKFCQDVSKGVWDVGQGFVDAWDRISKGAVDTWDAIVATLGTIGTWFSEKFTEAKDGVTKAFGDIGTWFAERWIDIQNGFAGIGTWFTTTFTTAKTNVTAVFEDIGEWFTARWTDIQAAFSGIGTWFSDTFTDAWDAVTEAFSSVGKFFTDMWETIKSSFTDIGTKVGDAIGGAFKLSINAVLSTVESTINKGMTFVNEIIDQYNNIPALPDVDHVGMVTLPRLAKGGIVTSSTIANIGEAGAEAVLPLNTTALSKYLKPIMGNGITDETLSAMTSAVIDGVSTALATASQNEKPIEVTLDGKVIYSNQKKIASKRGVNFGMGVFAR